MTSDNSRQPSELDRYLARHGFTSHVGNRTWLDRDTGQQIVRVVREPGEQTELICLTPYGVCLYKAAFSPRIPDTVIIAAVEAALTSPAAGRGRAGQARASGARQENGDMR